MSYDGGPFAEIDQLAAELREARAALAAANERAEAAERERGELRDINVGLTTRLHLAGQRRMSSGYLCRDPFCDDLVAKRGDKCPRHTDQPEPEENR